jgi:NADPH2:quinone reductase
MDALVVTEVGKPITLSKTRHVQKPGPSQVQVQVTVAGLNPHDQKGRDRGLFIASQLPAVLANDVVGRVTAVAEGVTKYAVGDRIFTQAGFEPGNSQNGLQQFALVDVELSAKIPALISDDQAATLPTNILAPLVAFFHAGTLNIPAPWTSAASGFDYAGQTMLIIGGGSNCGRLGVQLAALAGIGRIVVVGGDKAELESYGATHILSRHGGEESVLASIREIVGDDLIYAYDAINPPAEQHLAVNSLSNTKRGALARLLSSGGQPSEDKIQPKAEGYEIKNVFGSSHVYPELAKGFWSNIPDYLENGRIKPLTNFEVFEPGLDAGKVNAVLDGYRDGKKVVKPHFHVSSD